jgi:thiamine pyrophosphate-dependent acetolactate synthase large subunit-like protein
MTARMQIQDALAVLRELRTDQVVITVMGAAREWHKLSDHPLDLRHIPSCMGHAPSIGLGLALARPQREVIVLNGDGSMLMSLGSLVTIAAEAPTNLTVIVFHNGVYEVTGRQRIPGVRGVDFTAMAKAAGFPQAARFGRLEDWRSAAARLLASPGPRFIELLIEPVTGDDLVVPLGRPLPERLEEFRRALDSR